jgi:CRP/FNR family transcriptional regulator, cyclic AMP receptor protein
MAYKNPYPLSPTVLFKKIAQQSTSRDYKHKEMVFEQGTRADAMYYLQSGNVKLVVEAKNGKKAVLAILRKGDFFGEGCLGREPLRMFSATAIQRTTLARVRKAIIVSTIQQEPAFAKHFISHLVARIGRIEEDVVDQIFSSSEKRLARLLLLLANFGSQSKPEPVLIKISQETLAEMVGTTRSRVSHFMNRFRELGLISYNGELRINRSLLTFLLHDQ